MFKIEKSIKIEKVATFAKRGSIIIIIYTQKQCVKCLKNTEVKIDVSLGIFKILWPETVQNKV